MDKLQKMSALYGIISSACMIGLWTILYAVVFAAGTFAGTDYAFLCILFILVAAATVVILGLRIFRRHAL